MFRCHMQSLSIAFLFSAAIAVCNADTEIRIPSPPCYLGGFEASANLDAAREFADTLIVSGRDVYGATHTALFLSMLDLSSKGIITQKDPNWDRDFNCEDYMRLARGANLYRDSDTLRALYTLSRITKDARYRNAANDAVSDLFRYAQSPTTGLLAWGEHMVYNVLRDRVEHWRHEMEIPLPPLEQLWVVNPKATQRYIEGVKTCHIYDEETFDYDRHGNYYTGEFDDPAVRGKWIKHSGLYTYSYAFLYAKTGDEKYRNWALKMTHNFWDAREGVADLPGDLGRGTGCTQTPLLAWYLLNAYEQSPEPLLKEAGVHYMRRWARGTFDPSQNVYVHSIRLSDGRPGDLNALEPWGKLGWCELTGRTLAKAAKLSEDPRLLQHAERLFAQYIAKPMPETTKPLLIGDAIENALDLYDLTGNRDYLFWARHLAALARERLIFNGLIRESFDGTIYNNDSGAGTLASAWLRLHETELEEPCRWKAPETVSDTETVNIDLFLSKNQAMREIFATVLDDDGRQTTLKIPVTHSEGAFSIPPRSGYQGKRRVTICTTENSEQSLATFVIDVRKDVDGPSIEIVNRPLFTSASESLTLNARITDPSGIQVARAYYELEDGRQGSIASVQPTKEDVFTFSFPPAGRGYQGNVTLWLEACGNPDFPCVTSTEKFCIPVAPRAAGNITLNSQQMSNLPVEDLGIEFQIDPVSETEEIAYAIALPPFPPVPNTDGLPGPCGGYIDINTANHSGTVRQTILRDFSRNVIPETVALYRYNPDQKKWTECESNWNPDRKVLTAKVPSDGFYTWSGKSRILWRQSTDGALLCSPGIADLVGGPELEIILDTQAIDRHLRVFDYAGKELWSYEFQDMVHFPCLADLDNDGRMEIAASSDDGALVVLDNDGTVLWQVLHNSKAHGPAIGDIDSDGKPEVIAGWWDGTVRAFTHDGNELWSKSHEGFRPGIPALANLDGDADQDVVIGGYDGLLLGLDGSAGDVLWSYESPGRIELCASIGDLDSDGPPEIVFMSMPNRVGTLTCLNTNGTLRWSLDCCGQGDWTPTLCDMNGDGRLDVLFADREGAVHIVDATGNTLRRFFLSKEYWRDYMTLSAAPVDFNSDGTPDLVLPANESRIVYCKDGLTGESIWEYAPISSGHIFHPAKCKLGGAPGIADLNGDGLLEVIVGDDLTWLHVIATTTQCEKYRILSQQFHATADRRGVY
ncbi:MAG: FG-GAP-like repeat-containing protein [bacterium]